MPTPMPIINTAWIVKSGMFITLATSWTIAIPHPIPKSAVAIGKPAASTEPNATRRMITASIRPMASLLPNAGSAKMSPPISTDRPLTSISSLRSRIFFAAGGYSDDARSVKFTSAYAIVPPRAT